MGKLEHTYAASLFEVAEEQGVLERVFEEYGSFRTLASESGLLKVLENPQIPKAEKKQILERLLEEAHPVFLNFAKLLVDKGREKLLDGGFSAFRDMVYEKTNRKEVVVETAVPLTDTQRQTLEQQLRAMLGKEPILREVLAPELVMGFQLYVDGRVIDASLSGKFDRLKRKLKESSGVIDE